MESNAIDASRRKIRNASRAGFFMLPASIVRRQLSVHRTGLRRLGRLKSEPWQSTAKWLHSTSSTTTSAGRVTSISDRAHHALSDLRPKHRLSRSANFLPRRPYCAFHPIAMSTVGTPASTTTSPDEHRLPVNVKPVHYDLTIRTDLEKLEFDGSVAIE